MINNGMIVLGGQQKDSALHIQVSIPPKTSLPSSLQGSFFKLSEALGSIPGLKRSPGEGNGNPFQYSCLESPMYRGAWWAIIHGVAELDTIELLTLEVYLYQLKSFLHVFPCFLGQTEQGPLPKVAKLLSLLFVGIPGQVSEETNHVPKKQQKALISTGRESPRGKSSRWEFEF